VFREAEGLVTVNKGIHYHGCMKITLSLDEKTDKELRKIAVERNTTLTALVREYLKKLAAEDAKAGQAGEALEHSFKEFHFKMGKRTWKRADLYKRS
jgi:Family of unknown function (DUF6364)